MTKEELEETMKLHFARAESLYLAGESEEEAGYLLSNHLARWQADGHVDVDLQAIINATPPGTSVAHRDTTTETYYREIRRRTR